MGIIKDYVAPKAVNPFKHVIDDLIEAGEGAAYELSVDTEKSDTQKFSAQTAKLTVQDAAREAGYSARAADERVEGDKTVFVFVLRPKRTRKASLENTHATEGVAETAAPVKRR